MSVHCHDDLGLAVANTLAGVAGGARQVEATINGIGERAGNAALEEVVMALRTRRDVFEADSGVAAKEIYRTSRLVAERFGMAIPANKAVVGGNAFAHSSGIHVDGVRMNRADDPTVNYKALVKAGYDRCASTYAEQRQTEVDRELSLVTERLAPGAVVLDVGCGAGVPVAKYLAAEQEVVGVDISSSMLTLARANVPRARFVNADIMAVGFEPNSFDAIVSFYAFFHVPRQEHEALLRRFFTWLKPGGVLLLTLARQDDGPGYTEDYFCDVEMYWSYFGPEVYRDMLVRTGLRIEREGVIGHGYGDADLPDEHHPFVFCAKAERP